MPNESKMQTFSTSLAAGSQVMAISVICVLSVGFLSWFFVALVLDEKKTRRKAPAVFFFANDRHGNPIRVRSWSDKPTAQALNSSKVRPTARHQTFAPVGRTAAEAQVQLLRLSDQETSSTVKLRWLIMAVVLSAAVQKANSQTAAPPSPLPTPAITGPLQAAPPIEIEAWPLGKLDVDGIVSGMGLVQSNHVTGDNTGQATLSNGQIFVQKTTGWWQFYVQSGAYNILALGTSYLPTDKAITDLYGPVPVAYLKLVAAKNTSVLVGALPTLMGAEYTFDFENMNIERGLLWNQENAVTRGIQLNQTMGKFTASLSWNDGYYSNRYSDLSGALTYAKGSHSLEFVAMGNLGQTVRQTLATPVQNNGSMYAVIYTYTKGGWIVQPYFQYGSVPTNVAVGVLNGASTTGGALLLSRTFRHGFSLTGRGEYIGSSGGLAQNSVNLMYGPGSAAFSITATPTFQYQRFFTRGDISFVRASSITPGDALGTTGTNQNQARGVIEVGFLF